ncbi:hypothetical protein NECAME_15741 [Necator americanus]|uniref:Uncharacterized protein n=1 Tax=Necator americanus TaxID=51031 RepID=W2SI86_NECAM|nr:hypothetical protein NECAME_15741 [Necator americanus]ETN68601.1 hypothetical protein NECAME_15741 [Necator americanus]
MAHPYFEPLRNAASIVKFLLRAPYNKRTIGPIVLCPVKSGSIIYTMINPGRIIPVLFTLSSDIETYPGKLGLFHGFEHRIYLKPFLNVLETSSYGALPAQLREIAEAERMAKQNKAYDNFELDLDDDVK